MKGLRAEWWGKAILSVSPSPLFLSQGWSRVQVILHPTCPPFIFFLSFSLPAPPTLSILSLSPLPPFLFSSILLSRLSLLHLLSSTPHPTISHLSSLPSTSPPPAPPTRTHTINCRLVRQTNRHNSPDKGIETLITSVLHKELKILQKKDVPLPL